jgi:hypothetical protein
MRAPRLIVVLAAVCVVAAAVTAGAEASVMKGRIIDMSCPGPCVPEETGHPFAGTADVVVTRTSSGAVVRRLSVDGSTFKTAVRPGRYVVEVTPYPDETPNRCWVGSSERVRAHKHKVARVQLTVRNDCLL